MFQPGKLPVFHHAMILMTMILMETQINGDPTDVKRARRYLLLIILNLQVDLYIWRYQSRESIYKLLLKVILIRYVVITQDALKPRISKAVQEKKARTNEWIWYAGSCFCNCFSVSFLPFINLICGEKFLHIVGRAIKRWAFNFT